MAVGRVLGQRNRLIKAGDGQHAEDGADDLFRGERVALCDVHTGRCDEAALGLASKFLH